MADNSSEIVPFGKTITILLNLAKDDPAKLNELISAYRPPLKSYLVHKHRMPPDAADDLIQNFLLDKILLNDWLKQVDRAKGKFRALLVRSIDRYRIDDYRKKKAKKNSANYAEALNEEFTHPVDDEDAPRVFEREWGTDLLSRAWGKFCDDCERRGEPYAGLLDARLLRRPPVPFKDLCDEFGFATCNQVTNAFRTARKRFADLVKELLREQKYDENEMEGAVDDLLNVFADGRQKATL